MLARRPVFASGLRLVALHTSHLSFHLCCVGSLGLDTGLGSAVPLPRCSLLLLQFLVCRTLVLI